VYKIISLQRPADDSKHRVTLLAIYWILLDSEEPRDKHKLISIHVHQFIVRTSRSSLTAVYTT
jgi:hypothetical protein